MSSKLSLLELLRKIKPITPAECLEVPPEHREGCAFGWNAVVREIEIAISRSEAALAAAGTEPTKADDSDLDDALCDLLLEMQPMTSSSKWFYHVDTVKRAIAALRAKNP